MKTYENNKKNPLTFPMLYLSVLIFAQSVVMIVALVGYVVTGNLNYLIDAAALFCLLTLTIISNM